jgi:hypothetical protein
MKFVYWNSFEVFTQGFEIRNFLNLALNCPWIILFIKGSNQMFSRPSKIQKSLFAISMKSLEIFISITNERISMKLSP